MERRRSVHMARRTHGDRRRPMERTAMINRPGPLFPFHPSRSRWCEEGIMHVCKILARVRCQI